MKLLCLTAALFAVATLATAQTVDATAKGRGVAKNADGLPAAFGFEVTKGHNADGTLFTKGNFRAVFGSPRLPDRQTSITMPSVRRAAFENRTATFSGPAAFSRTVDGVVQSVRGSATVTVVDRRAAGVTTGDPDAISIVWKSADGTMTRTFRGRVVSGDIIVRMRQP